MHLITPVYLSDHRASVVHSDNHRNRDISY